jgi:hypothetical protein
MNRVQGLSWVLIGVGCCGAAMAADTLPPSLRACMNEPDSLRRLTCFDRESALLAGASAPVARQADPAPAATAAATAGAAAAVTQSETDKFGYRGNMARADLDKKKEVEQGSEQLTAKVTEVTTQPNGGLMLTLDNGQIWQQKTADRAIRVRVGDQITIKRGVLNSFLLTSDSNKGSMRVARVK